jgi:hypothetical protein
MLQLTCGRDLRIPLISNEPINIGKEPLCLLYALLGGVNGVANGPETENGLR